MGASWWALSCGGKLMRRLQSARPLKASEAVSWATAGLGVGPGAYAPVLAGISSGRKAAAVAGRIGASSRAQSASTRFEY
jgi:hypothetical protein